MKGASSWIYSRRSERISAPEQIEFSGRRHGGNNAKVVLALADETGPVDISRAVRVPDADDHVFEVGAGSPWTVEVDQSIPSSAPEMTSFSGDEDTATPFFRLSSGSKEVTMDQSGLRKTGGLSAR